MTWAMVRRTAFVLCGLIVGALTAFAVARAIQIHEGRAGLARYAGSIAKSSLSITQDMRDAEVQVKTDGLAFCSDKELTMMREIVFRSGHVRDLGRMRDGKLYCSTGSGRLEVARSETTPDIRIGDTFFYMSGPILFSDHAYGFVGNMGGVSAVLNSGIFAAMDVPPYWFSGLLYDRAGKRVVPAFGHATTLTGEEVLAGQMVEREGIVYQPVCPERGMFCVVAAEPRAAMLAGNPGLVIGYLVGGTLLGAAGGLIVLLAYRKERSFERQLLRAIRREQLTVVYQPVVDLETDRIVAAEALVRWVNEEGELVRTDALISIAEEQGFVGEITTLVLSKVVEDLHCLLVEGTFRVTLNIATADLMNDGFGAELEQRRAEAGLPASSIGLEITERSTADQEAAIGALGRLKLAGHTVYIDDFGTGYSSLSYLHRLDAGALKIDRSFTQTVGTDAVTASVVPQILEMAARLGLLVVVEGIETEAQAEYFRQQTAGGSLGQGWFYGRPMTAAALIKLVRAQAD